MSQHENRAFGYVDFQGKDFATPSVPFNKLAISGRGQLLFVSLITDTHRVKQIRAILTTGAKSSINASGIKVNRPGRESWYAHSPGKLYPAEEGYTCLTHKLGYGMAHAMYFARMPGFMRVVTPSSLWKELKTTRFTTPILKDWMPHIEGQLRSLDLLEDAHGFNCQCGILSASTQDLDEIVTEGLQQRLIMIPSVA